MQQVPNKNKRRNHLIDAALKRKKITGLSAATLVGLSYSGFRRILTGGVTTEETAKRLAEVLEMRPEDIPHKRLVQRQGD